MRTKPSSTSWLSPKTILYDSGHVFGVVAILHKELNLGPITHHPDDTVLWMSVKRPEYLKLYMKAVAGAACPRQNVLQKM